MNKNLVMEELIKGHELATQIGALLEERTPSRELVDEVMSSISRALEVLGRKMPIESTRRNRHRKRSHPHSWSRSKAKTLVDGHSWRKYGQKEIHQAKFPRSYFRCTHRFDRGCKARRQVQQSEDDPSSYIITYFGEHTCDASEEILLSSCRACPEENSCMIDFSTNMSTTDTCQKFSFMNQGCKNHEEIDKNINSIETRGSSPSYVLELPADTETLEECLGLRSSIDQASGIWDSGDYSYDDMFCFESL